MTDITTIKTATPIVIPASDIPDIIETNFSFFFCSKISQRYYDCKFI